MRSTPLSQLPIHSISHHLLFILISFQPFQLPFPCPIRQDNLLKIVLRLISYRDVDFLFQTHKRNSCKSWHTTETERVIQEDISGQLCGSQKSNSLQVQLECEFIKCILLIQQPFKNH
nr:uncharacterized protein LOC104115952 [Nicotiana tomentosiformis]